MLYWGVLTHEYANQLFSYNPETGVLTRKVKTCSRNKVGDVVGTLSVKGYLVVRVGSKVYQTHRVIWLMVRSVFPDVDIDHKNQIKTDNSWDNLRPATRPQNVQNTGIRSDNTSGIRGVSWHRRDKKWFAYGSTPTGKAHLGSFATKEEAALARQEFARKEYGEFYTC